MAVHNKKKSPSCSIGYISFTMYFRVFLFVIAQLSVTKASPIPDQAYDEISGLCLSRREESSVIDNSDKITEDSLFGYSFDESSGYGLSDLPFDLVLSNQALDSDPGFISYDLALDNSPTDSNGQRKGSCPVDRNLLPSSFEIFNTLPPNPFIPSCDADHYTLCCKGVPILSPEGSANLGSDVLALPDLENPDALVNVEECIFCKILSSCL